MKISPRYVLFVVFLPIASIIGFACGIFVASRGYEKYIVAPALHDKEYLAANHLNILSFIRLNDSEQALKTLEDLLDQETVSITIRTRDPQKLPAATLRCLKQIKTYRDLNPSQGPFAKLAEHSLENIPKVESYKRDCEAGFCRLMESEKINKAFK